MKRKLNSRVIFLLVLFVFFANYLFILSCGGSGGGGNGTNDDISTVNFAGSVSTDNTNLVSRATFPVPGIRVSALGQSALTDSSGGWAFSVDVLDIPSSGISFSFFGAGVDTSVVVPQILPSAREVEINFILDENANAVIGSPFVIDGVVQVSATPTPEATPAPPLGDDACSLLNRVNVVINNPIAEFGAYERMTHCQADGPIGLLAVGNSSADLPFTYRITVIPDYFVIGDDSTGTVEPGQATIVDGGPDCDAILSDVQLDETVQVEIRVDIQTVILPDGTERIVSELISECGAGASVGNTTESALVDVFIIEQAV
jgi:hypothetical protein